MTYETKQALLQSVDNISPKLHALQRAVVMHGAREITGNVDALFAAYYKLRSVLLYTETPADKARRDPGIYRPKYTGD